MGIIRFRSQFRSRFSPRRTQGIPSLRFLVLLLVPTLSLMVYDSRLQCLQQQGLDIKFLSVTKAIAIACNVWRTVGLHCTNNTLRKKLGGQFHSQYFKTLLNKSKKGKDLYNEIFKTLKKEIEQVTRRQKDLQCSQINIVKWSSYQKQSKNSMYQG